MNPLYQFDPILTKNINQSIRSIKREYKPLLGINLFQYAYILDFELDRTKYIDQIFEHIDWEMIENRMVQKNKSIYYNLR